MAVLSLALKDQLKDRGLQANQLEHLYQPANPSVRKRAKWIILCCNIFFKD